MHGRIFRETADGRLHLLTLLALGDAEYSAEHVRLERLNAFLIDDTLLAHERAATFLGLISLSTTEEAEREKSQLPETYQGYYEFFSGAFSDLESSYLKFCGAYAVTRFAFNSRRLLAFGDFGLDGISELKLVPGPSARMEVAVANLFRRRRFFKKRSSVLFDVIEATHRSYSDTLIRGLDIYDDAVWEVHQDTLVDFEVSLQNAIFQKMCELSDEKDFSHRFETMPAFFQDAIKRRHLVDFPESSGIYARSSLLVTHGFRALLSAAYEADEVVINRSRPKHDYADVGGLLTLVKTNARNNLVLVLARKQESDTEFMLSLSFSKNPERPRHRDASRPMLISSDTANALIWVINEELREEGQSSNAPIILVVDFMSDRSTRMNRGRPIDMLRKPEDISSTAIKNPLCVEHASYLQVGAIYYARKFWTDVISSVRGFYSGMNQTVYDVEHKKEARISIHLLEAIENDATFLAFMPNYIDQNYLHLANALVSGGDLIARNKLEISVTGIHLVNAIWNSYEEI